MAVKGDCEVILEKASRILALIRTRNRALIDIEDNADLSITVTPAMKQAWDTKITSMQAEIKAIVAGW